MYKRQENDLLIYRVTEFWKPQNIYQVVCTHIPTHNVLLQTYLRVQSLCPVRACTPRVYPQNSCLPYYATGCGFLETFDSANVQRKIEYVLPLDDWPRFANFQIDGEWTWTGNDFLNMRQMNTLANMTQSIDLDGDDFKSD